MKVLGKRNGRTVVVTLQQDTIKALLLWQATPYSSDDYNQNTLRERFWRAYCALRDRDENDCDVNYTPRLIQQIAH